MRLATLRDGTPDGALLVVGSGGDRAAPAAAVATTLQQAMENWAAVEPALRAIAAQVEAGTAPGLFALDEGTPLAAPLPRAWQWLDGSAYLQHGERMQQAFNLPPIETDRPLMYQGLSDRFYGPADDIPFPAEEDGVDFEGELGVIVDAVPMGTSAEEALAHIRLIVQINDWSLRTIAPVEMKTGFGWVQAKPACSMAPFAATPDELGDAWRDGRVHGRMRVELNGERFGDVESGEEMAFGFHELVAHAARTRDLVAGTIIGSGTISSRHYAEMGSTCISERRAIDIVAGREPTPFLRFGDEVAMEARVGGEALFGAIRQTVAKG